VYTLLMICFSEKLIMSTDPFTGLNPSYCFIELNTKAEADRAKEEITGKATIYGRPVKVNNVVPKKDIRIGSIKSYDDGTPRLRNETYNNSEKPFAVNRWEKSRESNPRQDACKEGRRLYVGGLPQINGQGLLDKKIHEIFIKYKMYVMIILSLFRLLL
jgi:RNA recognition motif-containing protein